MINKKNILAITASIVVLGACVWGVFTALSIQHLPAGEYGAVYVEVSSGGVSRDEINGTITVSDGTTSYTIMDKNLGATVAGTGKINGQGGCIAGNDGIFSNCWSESIGDYFQRGNNYGFPNTGSVITSTDKVDTIGKGPENYYTGTIFITTNDNWDNVVANYGSDWSNNQNDNLRGGSGDTLANGYGGTNYTGRQGPCPAGFHVPSAGEWGGLVTVRWNIVTSDGSSLNISNGLPYFDNNIAKATQFRDDFLLPSVGARDYGSAATVYDQGNEAIYWSSSTSDIFARNLYLVSSGDVYANGSSSRANGFSVRCFQDK